MNYSIKDIKKARGNMNKLKHMKEEAEKGFEEKVEQSVEEKAHSLKVLGYSEEEVNHILFVITDGEYGYVKDSDRERINKIREEGWQKQETERLRRELGKTRPEDEVEAIIYIVSDRVYGREK